MIPHVRTCSICSYMLLHTPTCSRMLLHVSTCSRISPHAPACSCICLHAPASLRHAYLNVWPNEWPFVWRRQDTSYNRSASSIDGVCPWYASPCHPCLRARTCIYVYMPHALVRSHRCYERCAHQCSSRGVGPVRSQFECAECKGPTLVCVVCDVRLRFF